MLIRLLVLTALLFLVPGFPAAASSYPKPSGYADEGRDRRQDSRHLLRQLRTDLDLTKAQTRQIREILSDRQTRMESLRECCHTVRAALHEAVRHGELREEELRQMAHRQADCRVDRLLLRRSAHARISALLTPEQRTRWEETYSRLPGRGQHRGQGPERDF